MWALCGSGGAGAREAACRAWWSGATRKVSDPRPAAGWGKGRTRYAQPGGTAAASGSGGARTAEAGRGRCIRRAPRRFSRGLAARGAFSAAAAGLCNGDLPSPSAMARPARPLTRWLAEAPRADWRRGPTFRTPMPPPVPRFSRGRLSAPLRPRGKLPLLHPRLAGRSAPRHSFVRAFGRLFTARRGVSAVAERGFFRSLSPPCPPPPLPCYPVIKHLSHWALELGSEYLKTAFYALILLSLLLPLICRTPFSTSIQVPFTLLLTVKSALYTRNGAFSYVVNSTT